ncbi:MAG: hypothetical protein H0W62_13815 [Chitinophagales bacterium]|nr:hypothetical protein [Chitinophagales bacterium]
MGIRIKQCIGLHNWLYYHWIFLAFLVFKLQTAKAQFVKASAIPDSTEFLIGEPIAIHLTIDHPEDWIIRWIPQQDTIANVFQKLSESKIDTIRYKNYITEKRTITLTTFDTGLLRIPSFIFYYQKKNGIWDSTFSSELFMQVSTVAVDTSKAFRDIKKPFALVSDSRRRTLYIIPILLAGTAAAGISYYVFKKKKFKKQIPLPVAEPPAETALSRLQHLEREELWQKGNIEAYYIRITQILREYIESFFQIPALEHTSHQIITSLKNKIQVNGLLDQLSQDFLLADKVKFAQARPSQKDHQRIFINAVDFINKTKSFAIEKDNSV